MGDWSDYFDDFPEENPANREVRKLDPVAVVANQLAGAKREQEQYRLDAEIAAIVKQHQAPKPQK